jgi:hypothetical protein
MAMPADVLDAFCTFAKHGVQLYGPRFREADEVRRAFRFWNENGAPPEVDIFVTGDAPDALKIEPQRAPRHPGLNPGDRIELEEIHNDPCPIPVGTRGTVVGVVDLTSMGPPRAWQVWVKWDINRSLSLLIPPDLVKKIT